MFMMKVQHLFHHMRKRTVPNIVQQCSSACCNSILRINGVAFTKSIEHPSHQMESAERMSEARMFCALISEQSEAELLDATQSLKVGRVDQLHHQLAFVRFGSKANYVVNGIAVDTFLH